MCDSLYFPLQQTINVLMYILSLFPNERFTQSPRAWKKIDHKEKISDSWFAARQRIGRHKECSLEIWDGWFYM